MASKIKVDAADSDGDWSVDEAMGPEEQRSASRSQSGSPDPASKVTAAGVSQPTAGPSSAAASAAGPAEIFSGSDLQGLAVYPGSCTSFKTMDEADAFMRSKAMRWTPKDRGVPDDKTKTGKKRIEKCVNGVYAAMVDMSDYRDKAPETGKRRLAVMVPGRVSDADVLATAFKIVYSAINLHRQGSCLIKAADIATYEDRNLDFEKRIESICTTLRTWKTCVQDCLDGAKLEVVVHAPRTAALRKANNKRNNEEKGKDLKAGSAKRKAEGERKEHFKRSRNGKGEDDDAKTESESSSDESDEDTVRRPFDWSELDYEMETTNSPGDPVASRTTALVFKELKEHDAREAAAEKAKAKGKSKMVTIGEKKARQSAASKKDLGKKGSGKKALGQKGSGKKSSRPLKYKRQVDEEDEEDEDDDDE